MDDRSRMNGDDAPTRADIEAMRAWTELGGFDPPGDQRVHRMYSDGRIVIQVPSPEAAREIEGAARAHEEMHGEDREGPMRAVCEALARSVAAGPGPWAARNCATEKGRENLRRAGFEERYVGELGTVWVRPADGRALTPGEAGLEVAGEEDVPS